MLRALKISLLVAGIALAAAPIAPIILTLFSLLALNAEKAKGSEADTVSIIADFLDLTVTTLQISLVSTAVCMLLLLLIQKVERARNSDRSTANLSPHSFTWVFWLAFIFRNLGFHRFAIGKWGTGLACLFTFGLLTVGASVDALRIAAGMFRDNQGRLIRMRPAATRPETA